MGYSGIIIIVVLNFFFIFDFRYGLKKTLRPILPLVLLNTHYIINLRIRAIANA